MGKLTNTAAQIWRFGAFEFDAYSMELRRAGIPIKLREQPSRILAYLLEHAGRMVTREELRQHLWPSDTFVDFDHSLNTAVMTLREALGDWADKPLYIQTIPRKGYRFIAPVSLGPAARRPKPGRLHRYLTLFRLNPRDHLPSSSIEGGGSFWSHRPRLGICTRCSARCCICFYEKVIRCQGRHGGRPSLSTAIRSFEAPPPRSEAPASRSGAEGGASSRFDL